MKYDDCEFAIRARGERCNTRVVIHYFLPTYDISFSGGTFLDNAKLCRSWKQQGNNEQLSAQLLNNNFIIHQGEYCSFLINDTDKLTKYTMKFYSRIMEAGSSLPWHETLRLAIGENRLDASAVREYFRPLEEWLRNENLRTGEFIGWVYGKCNTLTFFPLLLKNSLPSGKKRR